ncbi:MAG: cupredoxin domain-containing protein [Candidatus Heimdallarchaeota archaeon]
MLKNTKKLLLIITIISCILIGEIIAVNAYQNQIDNELTPDLFDIGTINIKIEVSEDAFTPVNFTVKESATVNLTIESLDVGHTFEIVEYAISETIAAGDTIVVEFEADQLGEFTYSSVNCTETGTMYVEDPHVEGLPRAEDIDILIDLSHSNISETPKAFSGLINWTQDNNFDVTVNTDYALVESTLENKDVLIILSLDNNLTEFEIGPILDFISGGGSMLIAGSNNTGATNAFELTKPFGFQFANSSAMFINSTDLIDPVGENNTLDSFILGDLMESPIFDENQYVPLTPEIVTSIKYTGSTMQYNETWINNALYESGADDTKIISSYPLASGNETIFGDYNGDGTVGENETIGEDNRLIIAVETTDNSRILAIGSADILNNTLMSDSPDNNYFYQRAVQWLAKMYAIVHHYDFEISTFTINKGDSIDASASFFAQNDSITPDLNVSIRVWRAAYIEKEVYLTGANDTYFNATIDTSDIGIGTVYIDMVAYKQGYGFNNTDAFYVTVDPPKEEPLFVSVLYIITYVISIGIGIVALSFFFVRVLKQPKTVAEAAEEEVDSDEEDEDEVDLDEYETDEEKPEED